jgi:hypothetical protein
MQRTQASGKTALSTCVVALLCAALMIAMAHAATIYDNTAGPVEPATLWLTALMIAVVLLRLEPKRRALTRREVSERPRTLRARSHRPGVVIRPRTRVR